MFKEKQTILQYLFQEIKEEETVPNLFYEANTKDKDSTRKKKREKKKKRKRGMEEIKEQRKERGSQEGRKKKDYKQ